MDLRICPCPGGAVVSGMCGEWRPREDFCCRVILEDGREAPFASARQETGEYKTGVGEGFYCRYTDFPQAPGAAIETRVWVEAATGHVRYDLIPLTDFAMREILWPAPMEMESREGKTALPFMQGCLLDNFAGGAGRFDGPQIPCSRGMTMAFFAQYDRRGGYVMIAESPFDCGLWVDAREGESVRVCLRSMAVMGRSGGDRHMRLIGMEPGSDYNRAAEIYREYVKEAGGLVTLREKAERNPRAAEYVGIPVCHTISYIHIKPESAYYDPEHPQSNDRLTTFDQVGEKLERLKGLGVEKLCLHLDGWQRRGYDNLHPDALPPCEKAGGWEGLKRLKDTCHRLGYYFGIHDQYRDYFYDCDSFDLENAARRPDGGYEDICVWYGGRQTVLCGKLALDYVRRNYARMDAHGTLPDNAYLDVFSVVDLDECVNPAHRMTREECAMARAKCFRHVGAKGVVVQSEECVDWALPYIDFVHHMPFALDEDWDKGKAIGHAIPLEFLVYHECIIAPFFPIKGGFGVPEDVDGGLLSLLYGCGTYIMEDADEKAVERMKAITQWQRKVQYRPMTRHEILEGRRERCEFEGGYACTVDFETGEYALTEP